VSKTYKSYFNEVKQEIGKAKKEKVTEAAMHIRNATVKKLSGNGTGKRYQVPGTSKFYTASSPGQPPAVLFGDLRKSITFDIDGDTGYVGSGLKKAPDLELGTYKIAARPFLKPTFEEEVAQIGKILGKMWFE